MKTILFCFLLFNSFLYAQDVNWSGGSIVLDSDEVRVGELCVHDAYDLVLFRYHDSVTVYPAHRIHDIRYYDDVMNINRKYISVMDEPGRNVYRLYEVVLQGEWSVLRRSKNAALISRNKSDKDDYHYFLKSDQQFVSLMNFRTKVYPLLLESSRYQLNAFIAINKLNINSPSDAIRIIRFYNKKSNTTAVASLNNDEKKN